MKKRIISLLLAVIMLLTGVPYVSAADEYDADASYTVISTYEEFLDFLDNAYNFGDLEYYRLGADISADGNVIGEYEMKNIVFDGNGHKITGLNIENALFASIEGSYFRNVTFENATVTGAYDGRTIDVALLSQKITKDSYITNLIFKSCNINIAGEDGLYVAFIAAYNEGNVTNCIIENNCIITVDPEIVDYSSDIIIGGMVAYNTGEAVVTNCISKMQYSVVDGPAYTLGGIVGENRAVVTYCYADIASSDLIEYFDYICGYSAGNYYNEFHAYKDDGSFVVYETTDSGKYSSTDVYVFAAEMSEKVMNENTANLFGRRPDEDLPALWAVENGDLWLSFDGKTGQVYLTFADDISNNIKVNGVASAPHSDIRGISYYFRDNKTTREVVQGKKFSVRVGSYSGGNYVRNYVDFYVNTLNYKEVNAVIQKPLQKYVKNMTNVFDGDNGTYSDMFYEPDVEFSTTYATNHVKIQMYPFSTSVTLSNIKEFDEIRDVLFVGEGTDEKPFEIGSGYELMAMSYYVNSGKKLGSLRYNEASYVLTCDIDLNYADFISIGSYSSDGSTAFRGHFNGNGYFILNLRIVTTSSYTGLFGVVKGIETDDGYKKAVIENVSIHGADVADADFNNKADIKGVLVGQAEHAVLRGCVAMGDISGGTFIGGLAGYTYYTDVINCGADVTAFSYHQWTRLGGLIGNAEYTKIVNSYTLSDPYTFGVIDETYVDVGILVGKRLETTYEHCFYDNLITIFNYSDMNDPELSMTYSKFGMRQTAFLDALVYYSAVNGLETTFMQSSHGYSIPVASTKTAAQHVAVCASTSSGSLQFVYYPDQTWRKFRSGNAPVYIQNNSDKELKGIVIKDFNGNVLDIEYSYDGDSIYFTMPYCHIKIYPVYTSPYLEGGGTEADPYIITSYDDLVLMAKQVNESDPDEPYRHGYYLVVNDINCDYEEIPAIGISPNDKAYEHAFAGTFDGNGHRIHTGVIDTEMGFSGLFYALEGAEIRDLYLDNLVVMLPAKVNSNFAGSILAANVVDSKDATKFVNISVDGCYYYSSTPSQGVNSKSSVSFFANNVVSDAEFINILIKNTIFNVVRGDYFENRATIFNAADSDAEITMKNILALQNINDFDLFTNATPSNIAASGNVYSSIYKTSDDPDYFMHSHFSDFTTRALASKIEFADQMNEYARTNLMSYVPATWSSINDETDIILGISDDIKIEYDILYDDVFTTSETKLLDMEYAPVSASANEEVCIYYFSDADVSSISIKTISGETVPFSADIAYQDPQFGVIRFMMPTTDVIITNNNEPIEPLMMKGIGTEEDPYVIVVREHLVLVANVINGLVEQYKPSDEYVDYDKAYYIIERDIDMTGITWDGIGTSDLYFSGQIDGQENYIKFLNKNTIRPDNKRAGLFTRLESSAVIKNLKLINSDVYNTDTYHNAAGAIAMINYGRIEKCVIINLNMTADNLENAGAIAGKNLGAGIIENCAVGNSRLSDLNGNSGSYLTYMNQSSVGNCFIYGCYWNTAKYDIAVESGIKPEHVYYDTAEAMADTGSYAIYKSREQFASGEVTYLLNNAYALKENIWRQNLPGFSPVDQTPVLDSTHRVVDYADSEGYFNRQDIQSTRYAMVGDTNVDGKIGSEDLKYLRGFFNRLSGLKLRGMIAADINADGVLDKNDYDILEKYIKTGIGKDEYNIGVQLPIVYKMPVNAQFMGDLNGDFEITETDLKLLEENFSDEALPDEELRQKLDINLDGTLDEKDIDCMILYLDAVKELREYGGFPGKAGYIGAEIDFDKQPEIPEEPEKPVEPEEPEDDKTPEDEKEDDTLCDTCGKNHDNFIIRVFCFFTRLFVTLFKLLGIW